MWPPTDFLSVLLLLMAALVLVFVAVICLGLVERFRNTERWRRAAADGAARRAWLDALRREAEAAVRDGGTRSLE